MSNYPAPAKKKTVANQAAELAAQAFLERKKQLERMTPAERQAEWEAEQKRLEEERLKVARLDEEKLKEAMGVITNAFKGLRPRTFEELLEYHRSWTIPRNLESKGLPPRFIYRVTEWEPKQARHYERVRELCRGKGAIVALCGNRGVGKTTIAAQVMWERMEANVIYNYLLSDEARARTVIPPDPGRYEKLTRLGMMFKAMFAGFGSTNAEEMMVRYQAWCSVPFLVIDEVHDAEAIAPAMALLVDMVDRRYSANLDTVLISNRDAEEFRTTINPSIASRIAEHGAILKCDWSSFRKPQP